MAKRCWLFKSEPNVYSIDDLKRDGRTMWEGIRNYQARNSLRDEVQVGDGVLFYHSNAKPPSVVGTATVVRAAYPDPTQFDPKSRYHDAKASEENPRWVVVDVEFDSTFAQPVGIDTVKGTPELAEMVLVNNSRLSVQPVSAAEWRIVTRLGKG